MEPECWFRYIGRGLAISGHGRVLSPREPYLNCCPHRATERFLLVLPLSLLKQIVVRGAVYGLRKQARFTQEGENMWACLKHAIVALTFSRNYIDAALAVQGWNITSAK